MGKKVAIIGASSNVSREILTILSEKGFLAEDITALEYTEQISNKQAPKDVSFGYQEIIAIQNLEGFTFKNIDMVIVTDTGKNSEKYTIKAHELGCAVIDCSGKHEQHSDICLVSPDVNPKIIMENYSCKTIHIPRSIVSQIAITLKPLHDFAHIKRVVISTYQSVSELGKAGQDELYNNTKKIYENNAQPAIVFPKQIAFNVIPQVDKFMKSNYTSEEEEIYAQLKKILDEDIAITATCAHVPVFVCHSASINIEFKNNITVEQAKRELAKSDEITVIDRPERSYYATPVECAREDTVLVSRIRKDDTVKNGLNLWAVCDNIRRIAQDVIGVIDIL